jgi:asparagine synthase (glutamine-hydrolysing)
VSDLLHSAVERRLVADVPFGAFLSGGIDSSAVVGMMSRVSSEKVRTFSVTFNEGEFSEAVYANIIAKKFNTDHTEIKLTANDFLTELPFALDAMDHPSGDGPNTYVVSKATRKAGITMALSGLGGDELFCGYDIFKRSYQLEKKFWLNFIPRMFRTIGADIYKAKKKSVSGDKIAELLSKPVINFEYAYPVSRQVLNDRQVQAALKHKDLPFNAVYKIVRLMGFDENNYRLTKYSIAEISTYMQNVLLRDTDQMSMASALEVRVPFLDYKLVEYVLGVQDNHKFPHTSKKLLVDSLGELLPPEISNRPKMGFVLPWQQWLKAELKEFCETNLHHLTVLGSIDKDYIESLWNRFMNNDPRITWSRVWHLVVLGHWIHKMEITD